MTDHHNSIPTDREELVRDREQQHQEAQTTSHMLHYEALGTGLATLCHVFYAVLCAGGIFTHEETLSLLRAALRSGH